MDEIEGREPYHRIRVDGGTYLTPLSLTPGGIEVRPMSGETILEASEDGRSSKEGICQEDTGIKGV